MSDFMVLEFLRTTLFIECRCVNVYNEVVAFSQYSNKNLLNCKIHKHIFKYKIIYICTSIQTYKTLHIKFNMGTHVKLIILFDNNITSLILKYI